MSKLENIEVSTLVELQNILEKSNTSMETWVKAVDNSEEILRYDLTKANFDDKTITIIFIGMPKDYHY